MTAMTARPWGRDWSIVAVLACSLILNVILARQLYILRRPPAGAATLRAGMTLPPLVAKTRGGAPATVSFDANEAPTVIYVLSPACIWCERNASSFKTLREKKQGQFRFVAVSLAPISDEDVAKLGLENLDVLTEPSRETVQAYRLRSTPRTILVRPGGTVATDIYGAYQGHTARQVERIFGMNFENTVADVAR